MATNWTTLWDQLSERGRFLLLTIAAVERRQEIAARRRAASGEPDRLNPDWAWVRLDPLDGQPEPELLYQLRQAGMLEAADQRAIKALERGGYVAIKERVLRVADEFGFGTRVPCQGLILTERGRELARVNARRAPETRPRSEPLTLEQWSALVRLYAAGELGLPDWELPAPAIEVLRNYGPPLVREMMTQAAPPEYNWVITDAGMTFVEDHRREYATVHPRRAPQPILQPSNYVIPSAQEAARLLVARRDFAHFAEMANEMPDVVLPSTLARFATERPIHTVRYRAILAWLGKYETREETPVIDFEDEDDEDDEPPAPPPNPAPRKASRKASLRSQPLVDDDVMSDTHRQSALDDPEPDDALVEEESDEPVEHPKRQVTVIQVPPRPEAAQKDSPAPDPESDDDRPTVTVRVEAPISASYTREVPLKEHHITCKWCGQEATLWRYPGRPPTLCCDECKRAYERERDRENNRKRQRRYRERQERKREARRLKAELKRLQEAQQATELQSETD